MLFFFFLCIGAHRDLHRVDRRQRQMCIRDSCNAFPAIGSDWNYVAPTVYALIAFAFIILRKYENNMGY